MSVFCRTFSSTHLLVAVLATALCAACLPTGIAFGDATVVESRIESVGMFKNGLAYVTRTIELPASSGEFMLMDVPEPAHGSFWIESPPSITLETRVAEREIAEGEETALRNTLIGSSIEAHFKHESIPVVEGTILADEASEENDATDRWNRDYEAARSRYGWYGAYNPYQQQNVSPTSTTPQLLRIQTSQGVMTLDPSIVEYAVIESTEGDRAILTGVSLLQALAPQPPTKKAVMLFNVNEISQSRPSPTPPGPVQLRVSYLTKGIAWAPSYQVDISDPTRLGLLQKSVIKNELEDIDGAELFLITGFPSIEFGSVNSPLSLTTTWTNFFQQVSAAANPSQSGGVIGQQAVIFNNYAAAAPTGSDLAATPTGEGPDLHYQSIGRRTLALGESLALTLPSAEADYERLIEWKVPDRRDARGHYPNLYNSSENAEEWHGVAWDSLRYKNPFDYPMTTGPAMVVADGQVYGQKTSYFVNPGEMTVQHVTKALSLRVQAFERELEGTREVIYIGGNDYHRSNVEGHLTANNHRNETVTLIIRRNFSGELISADGDPDSCLLADGAYYSVNQRNELIWTVTLEPGEDIELTYQYKVLVDR
jgi:hypothetical protein